MRSVPGAEAFELARHLHCFQTSCIDDASVQRSRKELEVMLHYALTFLIIALVAAFLGFGGIAGMAASIAKILFFVFLVLAVVSLLVNLSKGRTNRTTLL